MATTIKERFTNGNLTFWEKVGEKVIGGVILALIIGSFTVWRNQAVIEAKFEAKMDAVCANVTRIEKSVIDFVKRFDEHLTKK